MHYQVKDEIVTPLRWDGFGLILDFSYGIFADKSLHQFDIRIPVAFPQNRYDHKAAIAEINLDYGLLGKIGGRESAGQTHFGAKIDWSYNFQYYYNWDDSHMYWLNAYELGPVPRLSNSSSRAIIWLQAFIFH